MRLAALSYNIPQSYPIFQVEIEKLLVSFARKCGFSGDDVLFCGSKEKQRSFSRWWRGGCFYLTVKWLALRAGQRQGGVFRFPPPYLWTPLSPQRVKGCSPLTNPRRKSKPKNASRFAKRIFLCFSHLRLRRRFYLSAGLYALRGRNTSCEAANRRNEKKALSEAASFFPFRQLLRDYQGRAALDSCLPRLESSGCFSGSLLARKRELSLTVTAL